MITFSPFNRYTSFNSPFNRYISLKKGKPRGTYVQDCTNSYHVTRCFVFPTLRGKFIIVFHFAFCFNIFDTFSVAEAYFANDEGQYFQVQMSP